MASRIGIAGIKAGTLALLRFSILTSRDNCLCTAPRNGLVTALRVVGTITADARDGFAIGNLVEQAWQHRRIAGCVIGYFDSVDFERGRIDAKMALRH